jgi:hypothetical protein
VALQLPCGQCAPFLAVIISREGKVITFKSLVDTPLRALRRTNEEADRKLVKEFVNKFYLSICRAVYIKQLGRRITIDLSSSLYSDGMWLKSNMADILQVLDVEDGFEYVHRDRPAVDTDELMYRYYDYVPSGGAAAIGSDAKVNKNATTFEAASLVTDYTGQYIKFGGELGCYLLTAIKTFSPAYKGDNLPDGTDYVVRPEDTRKLVCIDNEGEEITDASVYVDYWELPMPLYRDTDMPLLASTRALELMVMREAMIIIGKRALTAGSYVKEIEDAMDELIKLNPRPNKSTNARDATNAVFSFNKEIFADRDDQ